MLRCNLARSLNNLYFKNANRLLKIAFVFTESLSKNEFLLTHIQPLHYQHPDKKRHM